MNTTPRQPALIGTHLATAGKLATVPERAADLGAESVQVFLGNPRGWATTPGDPASDAAFRACAAARSMPVLVHAPYLVNVGSPTPLTYERSKASVAHAMRRGHEVGASGVVVHTGSCVAQGSRDAAMKQVREALLPVLDGIDDDGPALLLEPTAGQGQSLCATIDDLASYLDVLDHHPRARICFDTCHAFAAGHDVAEPGGMTAALDALVSVAGPGRLAAIHANDSKDVRGSFRDRHERIGAGHIGSAAFAELLRHPAVAGLPVVLETPGGPPAYAEDLALLRKLR
ncbi:deoxyribonuclease IV [Actinobacteria bacterium YIM 96077]|uniref:Probable endonuclease 4 n=1 Tax=Phytoactinopolyspora halophila TaxID=1981511 RepID=A0A329QGC6_9ACTN|nr:deoxyribonuclease IV [Actinobacteria bacterium YIM 96077]RAW11266.1 endonuclease IV [Phytoactinopolyspora halophila]